MFCSHGAGYLVKWDEVPARAHVSSGLERRLGAAPAAGQTQEEDEANARRRRASAYCGTLEQDKELLAIFERTYGKIKRRGGVDDAKKAARAALHTAPAASVPAAPVPAGPDYLLVDGYNVIFAWDALRRLAQIAFGRANDCVRLVLEDDPPIGELDLTLLSEVKRSEKGAIEVRLADRIRALEELLQAGAADDGAAAAFFAAVEEP